MLSGSSSDRAVDAVMEKSQGSIRTSPVSYSETSSKNDDRDQFTLARMGKKQVLKRKFGFLSIFGFSCTVLITWEGVLIIMAYGLENGGPVGMLGQFIFVWIGTFCTFVTIGELASMAPTAAGQYHWVAMLAPKSMRNFLSYLTGWMTIFSWVTSMATAAYLTTSMTQAIAVLNNPAYIIQPYQITLTTWLFVLICVFFNTIVGSYLPKVEGAFLIIHILGFFGILVPLVYYAPHGTASEIFSQANGYVNGGDWATWGTSFMVGTVGIAFAFVGADAAIHMSEEIENPTLNVPRSVVASLVINGLLGFGMLIAVLFCIGDVNAALAAIDEYGYPYIEIFQSATQSVGGATAMACIIIVLAFAATVGFLATTSRMIWSFARDKGLPFSPILSKVSTKASLPVAAVLVASIIPCLLELINLGSVVVFNQVTSLALGGFYSTYFICCFLLFMRRLQGTIKTSASDPGVQPVPAHHDKEADEYILTWGPWHVKGWFGIINNFIAISYLIIVWVFSFFPPATPVNAANMNYSSLVFGATILYSITYYVIWGRKQYKGPVIEICV